MTLSVTPQASPLATRLVVDTELSNQLKANVTGAPGSIYGVEVENIANPVEEIHVKLWDSVAPDIGTTPPDWEFKVDGGGSISGVFPKPLVFSVGLSMICVLEGGTGGVTPPINPVIVRVTTT